MANELPSATPEKGSDDQSATNNPKDKKTPKPKNNFYPPKRNPRKKSSLTEVEWGGFFVDIYVTLWVWSDLIDCRDIKRLVFLLATVFVAHGVLCYFLSKFFKSWRFALVIWFALCLVALCVAYKNSQPLGTSAAELKPIEPTNIPPAVETNPATSGEYELLSSNVVSNIEQTLKNPKMPITPAVSLIYPIDPDESSYDLSEQLRNIFWDCGYPATTGTPPKDIPPMPGVSCFLYGKTSGNLGIWQACVIISKVTCGHIHVTAMPGDEDPWFTNSVVVIIIRKMTVPTTPTPVVLVVPQPPIPVEPLAFRQKNEGVFILPGGDNEFGLPPVPSGETATKDIGRAFLGIATHEHPSQIHLIADENQIILNIKFAPIFGMPPLELTNNELSGLPNDWDCNHSAKGIEIVNEDLVPIFQMYYKDDTHIVIRGAITFTNEGAKGFVFCGEEGVNTLINPTITNDEFFKEIEGLKIKRLFKYPAWQHPGEYAD